MNPVRFLRISLCIVAVTLIVSATALAQGARTSANSAKGKSAITGTVTDQTGAVLPGATATITNGTGLTQTSTTNDRGEYSLEGLPPELIP